jgi:hypothetical protein
MAEELFAVAAAEQEDEPLLVTAQFVQPVGGGDRRSLLAVGREPGSRASPRGSP